MRGRRRRRRRGKGGGGNERSRAFSGGCPGDTDAILWIGLFDRPCCRDLLLYVDLFTRTLFGVVLCCRMRRAKSVDRRTTMFYIVRGLGKSSCGQTCAAGCCERRDQ
eukprot:1102980-Prorocentrum_minimum.AAC.1